MISIIGTGTGTYMLTMKASERIKNAQVIVGASRIIDSNYVIFDENKQKIIREYDSKKIKEIINEINDIENTNVAVLVSGDTGFFSLSNSLVTEFSNMESDHIEIIPGISSVSSFFAKVKMPWQDAALISAHGRNCNIVDTVRRNKKTFILTGNNINEIAQNLISAQFENLQVFIGCNLDSSDEIIEHTTVLNLKNKQYDNLTVLLIINESFDNSVRCGIPDDEFIRGEVPMTKSEVRSSIISKLEIKPTDVCFDIGAGTGSVSVEMALSAWAGIVYAIEKKSEGIELINQNLSKFHIGNTVSIQGEATEVLSKTDLPKPDIAFIGGSDGNLKEIISILYNKNPNIRIVITAIALETLNTAINTFKELDTVPEIVQINISKNKGFGNLNLMMANNPVYIISSK